MLKLKPNCELCDVNLSADSTKAFICSYECTFCRDCVQTVLSNVCPNCGGGFSPRPIRPKVERRKGVSLRHQPASNERINTHYSKQEIKSFAAKICQIKPNKR